MYIVEFKVVLVDEPRLTAGWGRQRGSGPRCPAPPRPVDFFRGSCPAPPRFAPIAPLFFLEVFEAKILFLSTSSVN